MLKPHTRPSPTKAEMGTSRCDGLTSMAEDERSRATESKAVPQRDAHGNDDLYWPPPRQRLHHTTITFVSLHNCPKVSERLRMHLERIRLAGVVTRSLHLPTASRAKATIRRQLSGLSCFPP
eukprot:2293552-Prymnesium_polylepis.1